MEVDIYIEREIVLGAFVSSEYLNKVSSIYKKGFLESEEAEIIFKWCSEYYSKYEKAPYKNAKILFDEKSLFLDQNQKELIEGVLDTLSEEWEEKSEDFDFDYLFDRTVSYFQNRAYKILSEELRVAAENFDTDRSLRLLETFRKPEYTSVEYVDFFDNEELDIESFQQEQQPLFKFPGALGTMINSQLTKGSFIGIMGPEKRGKCIAEGQLVLLADGTRKPIEKVIQDKNAHVMSFNEQTQKFVQGKVVDWWVNGEKEVSEVVFKSGRKVIVTPNHPFLTPTGWKPIEEVGIGQFVANPKHVSVFGKGRLPEHEVRLLAYFIADGCLVHRQDVLFCKKNSTLQNDFVRCVKIMGDNTTQKDIYFSVVNSLEKKGKHNCNNTRKLLQEHDLFGFSGKEKRIPEAIFKSDKQTIALFLQVLFSCDGWAIKDEIGISFNNQKLVKDVQSLLLRFGIIGKFVAKKNCWNISIRSSKSKLLFLHQIGWFGKEKEILDGFVQKWSCGPDKTFLDRIPWEIGLQCLSHIDPIGKKEQKYKAKNSLRTQIKKKQPTMIASWLHFADKEPIKNMLQSEIFWDEIVSIKSVGCVKTYDLSVENYHNFIAEDCLVHNTWWLMEFAIRAARFKQPTVVFQAGDMNERQMNMRVKIRLAKKSDKKYYCKELFIPVLDCKHNQSDNCDLRCRLGFCGLVLPKEQKTDSMDNSARSGRNKSKVGEDPFSPEQILLKNPDYIPCDVCYADNPAKFRGAVFYKKKPECSPLTREEATEIGRKFKKKWRNSPRWLTYPANSLSVQDIKNVLDTFKKRDNFCPTVIVIDYADILRSSNSKLEERHRQNDIWTDLRSLSIQYDCLVITATQANAAAHETSTLSLSNFSEDKRKYSHVTAMWGLNQTDEDKLKGIMRLNLLLARNESFNSTRCVSVLQSLETGQPLISSFLTRG